MTAPHPAYDAVAQVFAERTGLSFPPGRRESAELGIRRAMARAGVLEPERYRALIASNRDALDDLIVELTVGETYFFREPGHFAFIRREVLPDLEQRLGSTFWVRAWSAACASGEEAYSLAILFDEEGLGERSYLLATDISRAALARARQAVYGPWSLRGDSAIAARPYLHGRDKRLVLDDRIRRRVTFEYLNLALDLYPSFAVGAWGMNLILCRNVFIYFDAETTQAAARRLYDTLAPGGWLFTASTDPPLDRAAPFETVQTEEGIFYRRAACQFHRATAAPLPPLIPAPVPPSLAPVGNPQPSVPAAPVDPLEEAKEAFALGNYTRAAEQSRTLTANAEGAILQVRALSNLDTAAALLACASVIERHPLSVELHYLHAVLLLSVRREEEAIQAVRRVLYLDPALAVAHLTLGSILERRGDRTGARRAYRNAHTFALTQSPDEPAPLSEGEPAGRLAETAVMQLALLDTTPEETT